MSRWKALRRKLGRGVVGGSASSLSKRAAAMQRIQWVLGIVTTIAVAAVWWNGFLDKFERDSIDVRAKNFASANAHPSDRIAVIAIDDAAMDNVGRWPWDRAKLAAVIDELGAAGASVIALDLLLDDLQPPRLIEVPKDAGRSFDYVMDDQLLGEAIKRHGRVVTAVDFKFNKAAASTDVLQARLSTLYGLMEKHPDLACQPWDIVGDQVRLLLPGFDDLGVRKGKEIEKLQARWEAGVTLASRAATSAYLPRSQDLATPWPVSVEPRVPIKPIADASRRLANVTFDSYDPDGITRRVPLFIQHNGRLWPTLGLAAAIEFMSIPEKNVSIAGDKLTLVTPDGETRTLAVATLRDQAGVSAGLHLVSWPRALSGGGVPVAGWERQFYDERAAKPDNAMKQLERALDAMKGSIADAEKKENNLRLLDGAQQAAANAREMLPKVALGGAETDGQRSEIQAAYQRDLAQVRLMLEQARAATTAGNTVEAAGAIVNAMRLTEAWRDEGRTQYGVEAEVAIGRLYEPVRLGRAVMDNWQALNEVCGLLSYSDEKHRAILTGRRAREWKEDYRVMTTTPVASADWRSAAAHARELLGWVRTETQKMIDMKIGDGKVDDLAGDPKVYVESLQRAVKAIDGAVDPIDKGVGRIERLRAEMRERLAGKVCFVGWTATGSLADFVATSIHPRTPGVHLHVAVCNSVITGYQRVPGPLGGQMLVIVALGLVGTWIGVRSSVVGGPLLVLGALALWAAFACIVLWGMYDAVWSIAGPTAAAAASWLVVVLHRLLVEQRSRRKTEERFKSYVSPAVVDILVDNPSLSSMSPQQKELTVLFTDIAGFTTTAERLGSQGTAELLAVYLGTMTEVVQRHGATLDKYIGDAIMAFWGAPIDDPLHARHACTAAVEMMNTLDRLNAERAFGAAGTLKVRIGLATGDLMVGDFGNPPRNSSYTVIGDTANLSSRLEGANKAFGTRTLVSDMTRALAGEGFLWRRIGLVKVKGKNTGIWVHELLPNPIKGERTKEWLDLCESLIADYQAERFEQALTKAVQLRTEYHDEGFASAYGEAIAARQAGLAEGDFDGSITLTDK